VLCPQSVFMCFVWISLQQQVFPHRPFTLVFLAKSACFLHGINWIYK